VLDEGAQVGRALDARDALPEGLVRDRGRHLAAGTCRGQLITNNYFHMQWGYPATNSCPLPPARGGAEGSYYMKGATSHARTTNNPAFAWSELQSIPLPVDTASALSRIFSKQRCLVNRQKGQVTLHSSSQGHQREQQSAAGPGSLVFEVLYCLAQPGSMQAAAHRGDDTGTWRVLPRQAL
jgi:hypothetical protein